MSKEQPAGGADDLNPLAPRITIEQSPANDLYLILDLLLPAAAVVRSIENPVGVLAAHEESLQAVWRHLRVVQPDPTHDDGDRTDPGGAVRARGRHPVRRITKRSRTSLLR